MNNAGICHSGKLEATTEQDFDRVFEVNVKGFYNCMLASVEHVKANGPGVILIWRADAAGAAGDDHGFPVEPKAIRIWAAVFGSKLLVSTGLNHFGLSIRPLSGFTACYLDHAVKDQFADLVDSSFAENDDACINVNDIRHGLCER